MDKGGDWTERAGGREWGVTGGPVAVPGVASPGNAPEQVKPEICNTYIGSVTTIPFTNYFLIPMNSHV